MKAKCTSLCVRKYLQVFTNKQIKDGDEGVEERSGAGFGGRDPAEVTVIINLKRDDDGVDLKNGSLDEC